MDNYKAKLLLERTKDLWPYILGYNGINASYLKNKHGPCPVCGGKDRFRFDNKQGNGTFFCNQCGAGNGIKLLALYRQCSFTDAIKIIAQILGEEDLRQNCSSKPKPISKILKELPLINSEYQINHTELEKRRNQLKRIWRQAKSISLGDPVDCYLKNRGIRLNTFPSVLRYHPQLSYFENGKLVGQFPAMLALIQNNCNESINIHRTYLSNGQKANVSAPKKLMSPIPSISSLGSAIKLYKPTSGKLAIAEGIETALAFNIATQLPIWAGMSAGGMERIILPPDVKEIIIASDNDASGRGQQAAYRLAKRLLAEGRTVKCVIPPITGEDFADMLLEEIQ